MQLFCPHQISIFFDENCLLQTTGCPARPLLHHCHKVSCQWAAPHKLPPLNLPQHSKLPRNNQPTCVDDHWWSSKLIIPPMMKRSIMMILRELQHVTSQFSIERTTKSDSGRSARPWWWPWWSWWSWWPCWYNGHDGHDGHDGAFLMLIWRRTKLIIMKVLNIMLDKPARL